MSQIQNKERIDPCSAFLFYLGLQHFGERGFSLLSPLIQVLISSGPSLSDTLRKHVVSALRVSLSLVKLTPKINHLLGNALPRNTEPGRAGSSQASRSLIC